MVFILFFICNPFFLVCYIFRVVRYTLFPSQLKLPLMNVSMRDIHYICHKYKYKLAIKTCTSESHFCLYLVRAIHKNKYAKTSNMVNDEDVGFSKCKLRVNAFPGSLCKESNFITWSLRWIETILMDESWLPLCKISIIMQN